MTRFVSRTEFIANVCAFLSSLDDSRMMGRWRFLGAKFLLAIIFRPHPGSGLRDRNRPPPCRTVTALRMQTNAGTSSILDDGIVNCVPPQIKVLERILPIKGNRPNTPSIVAGSRDVVLLRFLTISNV